MTSVSKCLLNGEPDACLSPFDRGLQFGDGLFETLAVSHGIPQDWNLHIARLLRGCQRLHLPMPEVSALELDARVVCKDVARGVLKLIWTRGVGERGYRLPVNVSPTRIVSIHPWPQFPTAFYHEGIMVRICEMRLSRNERLAGIKHLNRLEQVLARSEWQDVELAEGLMFDTEQHLIEGTMSNLFLVTDQGLLTPDLRYCGIEGIMRQRIIEAAHRDDIPVQVREVRLHDLLQASEAFVCNSVIGIWPIRRLIGESSWSAASTTTAKKIQQRLFSGGLWP